MASNLIKHQKVVSSLPAILEANTIYFVRLGTGFDLYVTNSSGTIVAYPLNQSSGSSTIPELISDPSSPVNGEQWILNSLLKVLSTKLNNPVMYQLGGMMVSGANLTKQQLKMKTSQGTFILNQLI